MSTISPALTFKLDTPHNDENWHQWVTMGDHVYRDSIGRRNPNGFRRWLVVQCNNSDCPAIAIVRESDVEDFVESVFPCPPTNWGDD